MEQNKRKFLMVQSTEEEKVEYKRAANESGFRNTATWVRFLIHQAIKKAKREENA